MQALGLIRATEPIFFPCLLAEQAAAGSDDGAVCQRRFPEHRALISPQPLAFACLPPKQACAGAGAAWVERGDAELLGGRKERREDDVRARVHVQMCFHTAITHL